MDKSKLRLIKARTRNTCSEVAEIPTANEAVANAELEIQEMQDDPAVLENDTPLKSNCEEYDNSPALRGDSSSAPECAVAAPRVPVSRSTSAPRWVVKWTCGECQNSCIPVRSESRCLCGHRYKEHKASTGTSADKIRFGCSSRNCPCKHFFFVVAEGAWILRCRCKHKHTEHDSGTKPFLCKKAKCACVGFDR